MAKIGVELGDDDIMIASMMWREIARKVNPDAMGMSGLGIVENNGDKGVGMVRLCR